MVKKYLIAGLLFLFFLSSCIYNNEEALYDNVCDTSQITYSNDILPVFEQNCYECHHNGPLLFGNLDLANFAHIRRVVDDGKLLGNINHDVGPGLIPMPYNRGKLPDCTILKIENWVNQDIPQN